MMFAVGVWLASALVGSFFGQSPATKPPAAAAIRQIELQFRAQIAIVRELRAVDRTSVGIADAMVSGLVNLARLEAAHQAFDEARRLYVESVALARKRLGMSTTGGATIRLGLALVQPEVRREAASAHSPLLAPAV